MGLIAFCGFVLPWIAIAAWLYATGIGRRQAPVPWRALTDYKAPGDGAPRADAPAPTVPPAPRVGEGEVSTPHVGAPAPTGPAGASLH